MHQSEDFTAPSLETGLTLRDLYANLVREHSKIDGLESSKSGIESGEDLEKDMNISLVQLSSSTDISPPDSPSRTSGRKRSPSTPQMVTVAQVVSDNDTSPQQLRIEKPPSQDSSTHGSYEPSPRDLLMTEPTTAVAGAGMGQSASSLRSAPSKSAEVSPRKYKGLFSGVLRGAGPRRTSGSRASPTSSSSTSPVALSPMVSPRLDDVSSPDDLVPDSRSSSKIKKRSTDSTSTSSSGPSSPSHSQASSLTSLNGSQGKIGILSLNRNRKKDEKKAIKMAKRQEALLRREADVLIELVMKTSMLVTREELCKDLPTVKVVASTMVDPVFICSGPTREDELAVQTGTATTNRGTVDVAGRTVSTYPMMPGHSERQGTPICDSYFAQVQRDGVVVLCIADGCGWGKHVREAAVKAKVAMCNHIATHLTSMNDTERITEVLLRALGEAHYKIIEGKEHVGSAGTTTILGGVLAPVQGSDGLFCFMFISVGDCKAYCRKATTGKIIDLTMGSRGNLSDGKDPGGRIGPLTKNGMPDFRNLRISYCICEEGDILLLSSDGLSDNFDPELQGLLPKDLGLDDTPWDESDQGAALRAKALWGCAKMGQLVDVAAAEQKQPVTPQLIVGTLIDYCVRLTESSRNWLETEVKGQLPTDYRLYPGKIDHTTCEAVVVNAPKDRKPRTNPNSRRNSSNIAAPNNI